MKKSIFHMQARLAEVSKTNGISVDLGIHDDTVTVMEAHTRYPPETCSRHICSALLGSAAIGLKSKDDIRNEVASSDDQMVHLPTPSLKYLIRGTAAVRMCYLSIATNIARLHAFFMCTSRLLCGHRPAAAISDGSADLSRVEEASSSFNGRDAYEGRLGI